MALTYIVTAILPCIGSIILQCGAQKEEQSPNSESAGGFCSTFPSLPLCFYL